MQGCDASILLDVTPTQEPVEKLSNNNGPLVRGFEIIDDIKLQLEAACPGVVSCADLLAFATRDSFVFSGVGQYDVAGGRRDGLASLESNVKGNLPMLEATAEQNIELFERKGLTLEELVLLVGAHSIGSAHCNIVSGRFHDEAKAKDIDKGYWLKMQTLTVCQSKDQTVPFDPVSQNKMDSRFYNELLTKKSLIESDQNLADEPQASSIMAKMAEDQAGWLVKFAAAMQKLGETDVLVGDQGEVRKECRHVN